MRCKDLAEAAKQAKANADRSGVGWIFFSDTSGNARCERAPTELQGTSIVRAKRTWAGVSVIYVPPNAP